MHDPNGLYVAYRCRRLGCGLRIIRARDDTKLLEQAKIVELTPEFDDLPI